MLLCIAVFFSYWYGVFFISLCYSLFIPSTTDGHLNYFQFCDIMKTTDINILDMFGGYKHSFLSGIYLRVEELCCSIGVCLDIVEVPK